MSEDLEIQIKRKAATSGEYAIAYAILVGLSDLARAISGLDESLRSDHPLQGQTLGGLENALNRVAVAIRENVEEVS